MKRRDFIKYGLVSVAAAIIPASLIKRLEKKSEPECVVLSETESFGPEVINKVKIRAQIANEHNIKPIRLEDGKEYYVAYFPPNITS
jgi:hypothetical protein